MLQNDINEFLDKIDIYSYDDDKLYELVADQFNISLDKARFFVECYLNEDYGVYNESLNESRSLNESLVTFSKDDIKVGTYSFSDLDPYKLTGYHGPWSQAWVDKAWNVLCNQLAMNAYGTAGIFNIPSDQELLYVIRRCFGGVNGEPEPTRARLSWPQSLEGDDAYWISLLAIGYLINTQSTTGLANLGFTDNPTIFYRHLNVTSGGWSFGLNTLQSRHAALAVALYGTDTLNQVVDRIAKVKEDYEKVQAAKVRRGPRKKNTIAGQQQQQSQPVTPGNITISSNVARSDDVDRFLTPSINIVKDAGYDVLVKRLIRASDNRGEQKMLSYSADVEFGTAPDSVRIDDLLIKEVEFDLPRSKEYRKFYSSSKFRNLPERQFAGWVLRELENKKAAAQSQAQAAPDEDVEESYSEPREFDIDENKFLEREGFEGYYESLNESDEYTKKDCLRDLKGLTSNFKKNEGTVTAWDEQTRDLARDILRDYYENVEISDGRMSDDEEPSYVLAYYNRKK